MRALQFKAYGGPEVLEVVELPDPEPGEGEVLVSVARTGMNFADTHQRENDYLAKAELPLIPGQEVVGKTPDGRRVAAAIGRDVCLPCCRHALIQAVSHCGGRLHRRPPGALTDRRRFDPARSELR